MHGLSNSACSEPSSESLDQQHPAGLDPDSVGKALEQLLADKALQLSARNRRFLQFIVKETLGGRSANIKSYTIAVDVFGRRPDFDGAIDPIVRMEAMRLRTALANYYAGPGRDAALQITIPKGSYIPAFHVPLSQMATAAHDGSMHPSAARAPAALKLGLFAHPLLAVSAGAAVVLALALLATWSRTAQEPQEPRVLIQAENVSASPEDSATATGLVRSLEMTLSRFPGLRVLDTPPGLSHESAVAKARDRGNADSSIYAIGVSVQSRQETLRVRWQLTNADTNEILWSDVIDRTLNAASGTPIEDEITRTVASHLGQPMGGLIMTAEVVKFRDKPMTSYSCVLQAKAYYNDMSAALHKKMRACLEAAVAKDPDYAEAWAMLSMIYLDEDRSNFNLRGTVDDARARALSAARRAAALAPNSELVQEALLVVEYRLGHFQEAQEAGWRAIEINPNDPQLLADLGVRLFARGQWDKGVDLLRKASDRSVVIPGTSRITLAMDSYRKGEYREALAEARAIDMPGFYATPVLLAAIYAKLGDRAGAQASVAEILKLRPQYAEEMRDDLRSRHYTETFIDQLAEGLREAGLDVK